MSDISTYKLDKEEKLWKCEVSVIGIHGIWKEIVKVELLFEEKVWKPNRAINIINLSNVCIQFTIKKRIHTYWLIFKHYLLCLVFLGKGSVNAILVLGGEYWNIYIIYIVKEWCQNQWIMIGNKETSLKL